MAWYRRRSVASAWHRRARWRSGGSVGSGSGEVFWCPGFLVPRIASSNLSEYESPADESFRDSLLFIKKTSPHMLLNWVHACRNRLHCAQKNCE